MVKSDSKKIDNIEKKVDNIEKLVEIIATSVLTLTDKVEVMDNRLNILDGRVNTLAKDVVEVKDNIKATRNDVITIGDKFVSNYTFNQLADRVYTLEKKSKSSRK